MTYETIIYEIGDDHVATVTLNRPERLNSFNSTMMRELVNLWATVRVDDNVHVVVIQANGEKGFCSGIDRTDGVTYRENPFNMDDPGHFLGPKSNKVWKPIICAVHGIAAGGAFYFINEADIVLCSDEATFFDPHVTYGMVSALEPVGLARRIPLGEVMRWALMGNDERMSSERALQIGLVSEVTSLDQLRTRAHYLAARIAAKPSVATQGTVKGIWELTNMPPAIAAMVGLTWPLLGNPLGKAQVQQTVLKPEQRDPWQLR